MVLFQLHIGLYAWTRISNDNLLSSWVWKSKVDSRGRYSMVSKNMDTRRVSLLMCYAVVWLYIISPNRSNYLLCQMESIFFKRAACGRSLSSNVQYARKRWLCMLTRFRGFNRFLSLPLSRRLLLSSVHICTWQKNFKFNVKYRSRAKTDQSETQVAYKSAS